MGDMVSRINAANPGFDGRLASYPPQKGTGAQAADLGLAVGQDNNVSEKEVTSDHIRSVINKANENIRFTDTKFIYYGDVNRIVIKVVDRETQEVIREIPPEETIEILQKIMESAGLIFDVKR